MSQNKKTTDVDAQIALTQRQLMQQMQEAVRQYDELNPKDRLVLRLVTSVMDLEKEVHALHAARIGWTAEVQILQERVGTMEEEIRILTHKISKGDFPNLIEKFLITAKKEKIAAENNKRKKK